MNQENYPHSTGDAISFLKNEKSFTKQSQYVKGFLDSKEDEKEKCDALIEIIKSGHFIEVLNSGAIANLVKSINLPQNYLPLLCQELYPLKTQENSKKLFVENCIVKDFLNIVDIFKEICSGFTSNGALESLLKHGDKLDLDAKDKEDIYRQRKPQNSLQPQRSEKVATYSQTFSK